MPGPTEEQALRAFLESLNQESQANNSVVLQKRILGAVSVVMAAGVAIAYRYDLLPTPLLMFLSGLCGAAALGFVMVTQVRYQTALLSPFVDVDALRRRIDELQGS